ncbi:hypothetical protein AB0D10_01245 [Kitasatospora sp. NPDC048545]|uniref:hypothetical protein n=1 Tax=Kitasatospora sp. NPDC048545 TaxID=3157208 RepID=UPI0033DEDE43
MSLHRENVTWQSENGTWSIGFFAFEYPNREDYDHEWDVIYDNTRFWWLSSGHADPDAAMDAYCAQECNPGATTWIHWSKENSEEIARYGEMAAAFKAERASWAAACARPIWG